MMDIKKSHLVKSKSSNSAIKPPPINTNKKSRSNAEFPPKLHSPRFEKRRGVYVEKKATKPSLGAEDKQLQTKSPAKSSPNPRRDRKNFLDSVLNILSKCTTSTQYPDANDPRKLERPRREKKKPITVQEKKHTGVGVQEEIVVNEITKPTKQKYKSKVLNDVMNQDDNLIVFRKNIEMINTPSNYSNRTNMTDSNRRMSLSLFGHDEIVRPAKIVEINVPNETQKKPKKDKVLKIEEPTTLVAETHKQEEKGLYNFFVDLLETTIDVCDVNHEIIRSPPISKINFEIDETVAKKLEVPFPNESQCVISPQNDEKNEVEAQQSQRDIVSPISCLKRASPRPSRPRSPLLRWEPRPISPISKATSKSPPRSVRRKFPITQSYAYTEQYKIDSPVTQSLLMRKKSPTGKKYKKHTLMNYLKEQLKMDDEAFVEPQNLYEALRAIAENKRRCRRAIHFDDPKITSDDAPFSECWKRQKVISSSGKSRKHCKYVEERDPIRSFRTSRMNRSTLSTSRKTSSRSKYTKSSKSVHTDYESESYHSLEVQEFNYEPNPVTRDRATKNKPIVYTESTGIIPGGINWKDSEIVNFAKSIASTLEFNNHNIGISRTLSEALQEYQI